jgi:hypothetical protein
MILRWWPIHNNNMAEAHRDIEMHQRKNFVNGYPSLAAFIASDRDNSTSIYRGYHRLASRNLLYLEAELFELEKRQDELDEEDLRGDLTAKQYARDWPTLNSSDNPRCRERRELLDKIRDKIKEYRERSSLYLDLFALMSIE